MKTLSIPLSAIILILPAAPLVLAHCEVPCGIYDDQLRFEDMLEDQETIAKGIGKIREMAGNADPQSVNQTVRWINTKESHATNIQHTISQYFMTQRIKPGEADAKKLATAHAVMVAAMKCKQSTDPATAAALKDAILNFYRAYEGKEPQLGHHATSGPSQLNLAITGMS